MDAPSFLKLRKFWLSGGFAAVFLATGAWAFWRRSDPTPTPAPATAVTAAASPAPAPAGEITFGGGEARTIRVTDEQQKLIGIETEPARLEAETVVVRVPGRIAPDENQFAFITPRAAGIVRSVETRIGQDVKAGDVLATIESSEVGQARLDLLMNLQALDIALAQANWQEMVLRNTNELIERLKAEDTPEQIHERFADKPVGLNRERLMTAYTAQRLAKANLNRKSDLYEQEIIRGQQIEESKARFDADLATYQTLMDQMGYETELANIRAQQALRQAETSVLVAREKLQVLGVDPDDDDYVPKALRPALKRGSSASTSLFDAEARRASMEALTAATTLLPEQPASLYKLKAPFDGTVLDRELVVPGVPLDVTHRIFTLANLDRVWIEANINPGNLAHIHDDGNVTIGFTSDAYPDRHFEAKLLYTGDLVTEKTQTVTLLARAENPDRLLKPGMYIEVDLSVRSEKKVTTVSSDALVSEDERWVVFVRTGPEEFELREVQTRGPAEERAAITSGLESGEEVVTQGAFKLKAEWIRMASSEE